MYYTLDSHNAVQLLEGKNGNALQEWLKWIKKSAKKYIKHEEIRGLIISTVFVGLDLREIEKNKTDSSEPNLFETKVLDREGWTIKSSTYEQACDIHDTLKSKIQDELEFIDPYFKLARWVEGIGYCGLIKNIYTVGLCCNIGTTAMGLPYEYRYCYPTLCDAIADLHDLKKDIIPQGNWIKRKSTVLPELSNPNYCKENDHGNS